MKSRFTTIDILAALAEINKKYVIHFVYIYLKLFTESIHFYCFSIFKAGWHANKSSL